MRKAALTLVVFLAGTAALHAQGVSITSLSPTSGPVGTSVTITGSNFGLSQLSSTVTFSGTPATVSSWSASSIVVTVPQLPAGPSAVVVNNLGVPSNSMSFTVSASPQITGMMPTASVVGATVNISGSNFGATQGASSVTFNSVAGTPSSWSATSISVNVPVAATTGNVVVTVGGQASNGLNFTVGTQVRSLSPIGGPVGTVVTITGSGFGATRGTSTVTFNGVGGTPSSWSATSISVPVPGGATSGNVVVTVGGQASPPINFTVGSAVVLGPQITGITPASGVVGTAVTIAGSGFGAVPGGVTFNNTLATPTSWANTQIAVPVPDGATTGSVVVNASGQNSNGVTFTVVPQISNLGPASGVVGTAVTITGTGFGNTPGSVTFNGTAGAPTLWIGTQIVVPVPSAATTGSVVVSVGGQNSNAAAFTVVPQITNLAPASGIVGTSVTINGTGFGNTPGAVTFNGTAGTPTSWSTTQIVVRVPNAATTGNVAVNTASGASNNLPFTVPPHINDVQRPVAAIGSEITISGQAFDAAQGAGTVTFAGASGPIVVHTVTSWNNNTIVVNIPEGAVTGDIVITTAAGPSDGFHFAVVPRLTELSLKGGTQRMGLVIRGKSFGPSPCTAFPCTPSAVANGIAILLFQPPITSVEQIATAPNTPLTVLSWSLPATSGLTCAAGIQCITVQIPAATPAGAGTLVVVSRDGAEGGSGTPFTIFDPFPCPAPP